MATNENVRVLSDDDIYALSNGMLRDNVLGLARVVENAVINVLVYGSDGSGIMPPVFESDEFVKALLSYKGNLTVFGQKIRLDARLAGRPIEDRRCSDEYDYTPDFLQP